MGVNRHWNPGVGFGCLSACGGGGDGPRTGAGRAIIRACGRARGAYWGEARGSSLQPDGLAG